MADADRPEMTATRAPSYTLRVTFTYRGRLVRFAGSQRVAMTSPPSLTSTPEKEQSGYWFEARNADGALLFHRALHNPVRSDVEVHSKDTQHSMTRIPVSEPEGRFEVLVPDLPDARTFILHGTPVDALSPSAPSRELLRLDFDELRKPGTGKPGSEDPPRNRQGN